MVNISLFSQLLSCFLGEKFDRFVKKYSGNKHRKGINSWTYFMTTSEKAVKIQSWTALIAVLLLKFVKEKAQYRWHLSNLVSLIRPNLFIKNEFIN
ncbi:DUF4372 domain-containing protein [Olivibacter sp. SDN3]|uniref:DUF4372 domain-containing protein n=1 Tax=Olivibacter sp. SDN3 TaxID=2764720 RepID=UPI0016518017|nr:DUF4372 domain-containing protein [Olivibacter sp. SDN3]QNL51325.1 DUF4372 domain-containing protein [Olivibacter sp. SDN3]